MKKILSVALLLSILLPFKIFALTGNINLTCDKNSLKAGESTSCYISGSINEEVSSVDIKLTADSGLKISDINVNSPWQGNGENDRLQLYTENNLKNDFSIATFKITAESSSGSKYIKLSNIVLSDKDFKSTTFNSVQKEIKILSSENTLKSISINGKELEYFSANTETYTLNVDQNISEITIGATATSTSSTVSGDVGKKTINSGTNKFVIKVTSETGSVKNYTINVVKKDNRELKNLSINDISIDLSSGVYNYVIDVKYEIDEIELKAELSDSSNSFVQNYGPRTISDLEVGENEILIKIKDSNSKELTYKVIVKRLEKGEIPTTTKPVTTTKTNSSNNENVKNPSTGDASYLIFIFIILSILGFSIYKIRRLKKN